MPRPLILRVDDHKPQPNKKAIGSISVQLLKENIKLVSENYITNNSNDEYDATDISQYGTSLVRSLINKYESSTATRSNLTKFKSKSLADLPRSQPTVLMKTSQDDILYNKDIYKNNRFENEKFDFKAILSKFENPNNFHRKIGMSSLKNYSNENLSLSDIKHKARLLLENYRYESNYALWQNQVIELLQQIEDLDEFTKSSSDLNLNKNEEKILSLEKEERFLAKRFDFDKEFNNDQVMKVKDIKNIFEEKTDSKRSFSRANSSSYSTYFGINPEEKDTNKEHCQLKSSNSIQQLKYFNDDQNNDDITNEETIATYNLDDISFDVPDEVDALFELESSTKVDKLKHFFESEQDKHVPFNNFMDEKFKTEGNTASETKIHIVDNRMLPPPTIYFMDQKINNNYIATALERIKQLTKSLQEYEHNIDTLSDKNSEDANYINEELIKILIELDEIETYGVANIMKERKDAIQSVQDCIQKLKSKIYV